MSRHMATARFMAGLALVNTEAQMLKFDTFGTTSFPVPTKHRLDLRRRIFACLARIAQLPVVLSVHLFKKMFSGRKDPSLILDEVNIAIQKVLSWQYSLVEEFGNPCKSFLF